MEAIQKISVLLADELTMVREGLTSIIEASGQYRVVAQCADGAGALEMMERHAPQLAVLDYNLPKLFALEVIRQARHFPVATRSIVLSCRSDRKTVLETLRSGATAYVLKSGGSRYLLEAMEQVRQGGIYVSPTIELNRMFVQSPRRKSSEDPLESLSAREYQVFSLLVEGTRAKEIAARLELSPKTVDTYRASLMRKLDIHDVAGLVKFAMLRNPAAQSTSSGS
jgi:DNA-binding NarL/FixJ family response regulator